MPRKAIKRSRKVVSKPNQQRNSQDDPKLSASVQSTISEAAGLSVSSREIHQSCLFFSIPAEMRNRIYEAAYEDGYLFGTIKPRHWHRYGLVQHPLTLVCRQIRAESLPLYLNRFTLGISGDDQVKPSGQLFEAIGPLSTSRLAIRITNPQIRPHSVLLCNARRWKERVRAHEMSAGSTKDIERPLDSGNSVLFQPYCSKLLSRIEGMGMSLRWTLLVPAEVAKESKSTDQEDGSPALLVDDHLYHHRRQSRNELLALMSIK